MAEDEIPMLVSLHVDPLARLLVAKVRSVVKFPFVPLEKGIQYGSTVFGGPYCHQRGLWYTAGGWTVRECGLPGMLDDESVSCWIEELKLGRETAATQVWEHFYARLIVLARRKLRGAPRRAVDEEDIVASAFETFFRRAGQGQFPRLHDRHDLWHLLVKITERKALNQIRDQARQKRGGGKVRGESVFLAKGTSTVKAGIGQLAGAEPTPEFAALMAEGFQQLLDLLTDDELRKIALLKLEGYANEEIAAKINRSLPTVERRLKLIRDKWKEEYE